MFIIQQGQTHITTHQAQGTTQRVSHQNGWNRRKVKGKKKTETGFNAGWRRLASCIIKKIAQVAVNKNSKEQGRDY